MFHRFSLTHVVILFVPLLPGLLAAQDIQRGTLKRLDVEKMRILITADGKDTELTLTDETQVLGATGRDLAAKLKDFKEGSEVFFKPGERDGKQVALGLKLAAPGEGTRRAGDRPRRAKVKAVDVKGKTMTLTVGDKDLELLVTERTELRGIRGESLSEKLNAFPAGTDVMFVDQERDGKRVLVGIMPVPSARGGEGRLVSPEHSSLKPLDELGTAKYQGFVGGFYPDGQNKRPEAHEAAGLAFAAKVQPRNAEGEPDPAGKIVLLSIGMSSTSQSSQGFQEALAAYNEKNPCLLFVNGAQGGMTAAAIQDPDDGGRGTQYWREVDHRLKQAGVTRQQVQVVWMKQADAGPRDGFPAYARQLQAELTKIVQVLGDRFPRARLCYLSSRTYGGFATSRLNPEPYAYESGFAVKWLIEEQLQGNPVLNFDEHKGAVKSPWLSWGPYLWANGSTKRSADGFQYEATDFSNDGTHHSATGSRKVGRRMLEFFQSDSTTKGWFNKH